MSHCTLFLLFPRPTDRLNIGYLPLISGPAISEFVRLFQVLVTRPHQAPRAASCSQVSASIAPASSAAPAVRYGARLAMKQLDKQTECESG